MIRRLDYLNLSPVVQELWDLVEALFRKKISWQHRRGLAGVELGSRIGEDGTPIIGYKDDSIANDLSVSHELLHLWRFGCGVPIVNLGFDKALEGSLTNIQIHYEHLWIYTTQESLPFKMNPWNKPHSEAHVNESIEMFRKSSDLDLSWGAACDALLSRPISQQINRKKVSEISQKEGEKTDEILKAWHMASLDVPHSSAAAFLRILRIIGFDIGRNGFQWQCYDGAFLSKMLPTNTAFPEFSITEMLVNSRSDRQGLAEINRQRHEAVSNASK